MKTIDLGWEAWEFWELVAGVGGKWVNLDKNIK